MFILPSFPRARKAFVLLALTAILLTQQSQPAHAQIEQCGGRQDCVYAFFISRCTEHNRMPPRYTQLHVQVWDRNTNQVTEHRLIIESEGPSEYLYSVLVLGLDTSHRYQNRFVRSGEAINDWSEEWRPPTSVGMLEVFVCQQAYLPYVLGR